MDQKTYYMIFRSRSILVLYFSYFAFNVNKRAKLLVWIYFDVNYIYLQIHHHHVDMLCYYKTLTTNMSSNIFNCCCSGHICERLHLDT